MVEKLLLLVLLLSAATSLVLGLCFHFIFVEYCERLANVTGREEEFQSRKGPDGGYNWFMTNQWFKVNFTDEAYEGDERLNLFSLRLRRLRLPFGLSLAGLVGAIVLYEHAAWFQ